MRFRANLTVRNSGGVSVPLPGGAGNVYAPARSDTVTVLTRRGRLLINVSSRDGRCGYTAKRRLAWPLTADGFEAWLQTLREDGEMFARILTDDDE